METLPPFDVEAAIATWRRFLASARGVSTDDLDELEAHLRDEHDALRAQGLAPEEAFHQARQRVGNYTTVERAYAAVFLRKAYGERRLGDDLRARLAMLVGYARVAVRNLRQRPGFSFLNVGGLAVGMASCVLILLFVRDELSYDRFHVQGERIYRLVAASGDDQPTNANGSFSAGPALAADFPEVEHAVRFVKMGWGEKRTVARGDRRFAEDRFFVADAGVFDAFTLPFVSGEPEGALDRPYTIVLTASTARKYFGAEEPVGQTVSIDPGNTGRFEDFTVTGVMADLPSHSHIQFDFLVSFASLPGPPEGWGFDPVFTYLLLAPGADAEALAARLPAFLERHAGPDRGYALHLQPLHDIHLYSSLRGELEPTGSIDYVYLFSAIAVFVLLLACVNFMNLATAQSARRAREVGMRKVMGARRVQLVGQFLGEAVLLSGCSALLGLGLVRLLLPLFNDVAGKSLALGDVGVASLAAGMLGLAVIVGVGAGLYPAVFLSRFAPVYVLKGGPGKRDGARLREGLVVFQFAVSIALLVCTATVLRQMKHLRAVDLGFEKEQVVVLPLNDEVRKHYEAIEDALLQEPTIRSLAATEQVPARAGNGASYLLEGEDRARGHTRLFVNEAFASTYGIEIVAGRDLDRDRGADATDGFLVNEAFTRAHELTPTEAVGRHISFRWYDAPHEGRIVGVTRDFQLGALRQTVPAVVMNVMPLASLNFLSLRVTPDGAQAALAHARRTWERFAPSYPFDYYFLDADFERLHQADGRLGRVFGLFAGLAVLVACLGLFGLVAYTVEQRTKEIGIRKVLGASVPGLVALLVRHYLVLVAVAFVLAVPPAYYVMSGWLESFAYRTALSWPLFAAVGLAMLGVALLTVSYQAVRTALADPVDSLRYE